MKSPVLLLVILLFSGGLSAQISSSLEIPATQSVKLDYPAFDLFAARLSNKSAQEIDVSVLDKKTGKQIRGFGLAARGNAVVMVEKNGLLKLENPTSRPAKIKLSIKEEKPEIMQLDDKEYISFTLQNTSMKSIPLLIPSVMNPNLSPKSKSGVDLKIGQEIFFRESGKKYILLTVNNTIKDGDVIDVAALLKERKKELGFTPQSK